MEYAAEIVKTITSHRNDGFGIFFDKPQIVLYGIFEIDPEHLRARRHQGVGRLIAHMEDIVNHCLLCFFKCSLFGTLFDQIFDFILRNCVGYMRIDAN